MNETGFMHEEPKSDKNELKLFQSGIDSVADSMPTVSALFNSFVPSRDASVRKHSKSEFGVARQQNKMMHSMPAANSGFSLSMLLGNFVSTDFIPTTRLMRESITESGKTALVKALEFNANG